jgi:uncharacterized membrane protein YeaQ/YmgE (transglycosylase-associated protein family)
VTSPHKLHRIPPSGYIQAGDIARAGLHHLADFCHARFGYAVYRQQEAADGQKPGAAVTEVNFESENERKTLMEPMGLIAWLVVGAIAGWLASLVIPTRMGLLGDIVVGIVGGVIGGALFRAVGEPGLTGLSIWSIFVAFIGSVVLLGMIRLFTGPYDETVITP